MLAAEWRYPVALCNRSRPACGCQRAEAPLLGPSGPGISGWCRTTVMSDGGARSGRENATRDSPPTTSDLRPPTNASKLPVSLLPPTSLPARKKGRPIWGRPFAGGNSDEPGGVSPPRCRQVFTGIACSSPSLILASVTNAPLGSDINFVQICTAAVLSPAAS